MLALCFASLGSKVLGRIFANVFIWSAWRVGSIRTETVWAISMKSRSVWNNLRIISESWNALRFDHSVPSPGPFFSCNFICPTCSDLSQSKELYPQSRMWYSNTAYDLLPNSLVASLQNYHCSSVFSIVCSSISSGDFMALSRPSNIQRVFRLREG